LKVLHIISQLNRGGMGDALISLIRDLNEIRPDIISEVASIYGCERHDDVKPFATKIYTSLSAGHLISLIENGKYDVLHWWRATPDHKFSKVVRKLSYQRPPILLTLCQIPVNARYGLSLDELSYPDILIFICKSALEHHSVRCLPIESRRMIYFGVQRFDFETKSNRKRKNKGFIFGRGSTLNKCPKDMLRLFKEIPIPDAKFLIAGEGSPYELRNIERQIIKEGLSGRVKLIGQLNKHNWIKFLRSLDVFLYHLPENVYSAIDGTVQDAMLSELPVVLLGGTGPSELIVDGESGFIAQNKHEFIENCIKLFNDPSLRESIGKAARQRILKNFTSQNTANQYVNFYEKCAMSNPNRFPDGRARKLGLKIKAIRFFQVLSYLPKWSYDKFHHVMIRNIKS